MKNPLVLLLLPLSLCAQQPYFQQEVNYTINARLDDSLHILEGQVAFQYINHSPDTLRELRVHLWGNAFKNRRSAFCRQKLRDGDAAFYFAEEHELGGYKKPDFQANGKKINWRYDPENPDIARLTLTDALLPGGQVHISTPFLLRIPASFSRLGHVETSYQMTQWYPKPAVYDHKGWHDMPYLDIGEFYSEFGSFDVTLTLPENYVVGATGVLQTPSEIAFLHQKERETRRLLDSLPHHVAAPFPPSSQNLKTIRYTAEKVHDFAWFADKRFLVLKDTARLASGKTVDCWAMFPMAKETVLKRGQSRLWEKGAFYIRRAVEFYSEKVGEYPYPQATAVHSALSAGGGMEYPMITVIGNASSAKDLDDVITHEVGHNWFYGILASHERRHPFMDEGLNTYYQIRYIRQYYGEYQPVDFPKFLLNEQKQGSLLENGYLLLARDNKDTPPDSHSDLFTPIAYGLQVYMKPALCMHWLEQAVGTENLDAAMQAYYAKWQFRHPYPEDLQAVFQEHNMKADWFFQAMKTKHRTDYRLKKVEKTGTNWALTIQNKGKLDAPYSVSALKNGKPVATKWFEHTDGSEVQKVEMAGVDADAFEIDYPRHTLDINRKNNFRRTSGLFPGMRPIEFRSLAPFQNSRRNTLAALPWVGWNNYDKTMLGIAFYNSPLPLRKLQYYVLPGWGLGAGRMTGMARLQMHIFSDGWIKKTTIGAGARMFDFDYNASHDYYLRYWRIAPWVHTELRCNSGSFSHGLLFRTLFIGKEV
ncbi:MAG: M1 family metallopeptidase, partial [Saprospiraceae bacterium]|nr:M1 family metallopeptidase [Saprospiraceae bacterium]